MADTRSLFGSDTITFNGKTLNDFGSGEVAKITFPTELATVKAGKDGNTIFVQNVTGLQAVLELKIIRGSTDDIALNDRVVAYKSTPALYITDVAVLTKIIGSGVAGKAAGSGSFVNDIYTLAAGIPTKQPEVVTNLDGDTEQALSVYTWTFAKCDRSQ